MRVPSRWRYVWPLVVASHGTADTWLSGWARDRLRSQGAVLARWDGTAWHQVPEPTATIVPGLLSTVGSANTWAASGWVWHWDGTAWSRSYGPPAGQYRPNADLGMGSVASSGRRAWVVYNSVSNVDPESGPGPPTRSYSAYFDGRTWRPVPVPKPFASLTEVTMSAADGWALAGAPGGSSEILRSHDGGGWCAQPLLPWHGRATCHGRVASPTSISAAAPDYVVVTGGSWHSGCFFAYVYDGHACGQSTHARSADPGRPP